VQQYPLTEYRFWHALTQEVAYGTLLGGQRARLHAAVAEALIELDADRLDEEAAVIAWHWGQAGRRVEAAQWSLRAAAFALRTDLGEALRRWRATVDLLERVEETAEALQIGVRARIRLLQFGARAGIAPAEIERLEAEGRALAERLGDPTLSGMMAQCSGTARYLSGDLEGGLAHYLQAARLGEETDDPDASAATKIGVSHAFTPIGPLKEGLAWADRGLEACAGDPECGVALAGYSSLARILQSRAWLLARMGRLAEAAAELERSIALGRTRAELDTLGWALPLLPLLAWLTGDDTDTSIEADEAVRIAEETDNPTSLVLSLEGLALTHLIAGRPGDAATACERALAVGRAKRSGLFAEASVLAHLARARLTAGDQAGAATVADEAVDVARRQGARVHECLALLTRARVGRTCAVADDVVGEDLDAALSLVAEVGALTYEPFLREEIGRLRGDEAELRAALHLYATIGATGHAQRLQAELGG
jgi:tetratricopeptide (TPR) repeat protein